jgi:hypothetical protein
MMVVEKFNAIFIFKIKYQQEFNIFFFTKSKLDVIVQVVIFIYLHFKTKALKF